MKKEFPRLIPCGMHRRVKGKRTLHSGKKEEKIQSTCHVYQTAKALGVKTPPLEYDLFD
jgi:hypothetical protein